jgi:hypothetical protein
MRSIGGTILRVADNPGPIQTTITNEAYEGVPPLERLPLFTTAMAGLDFTPASKSDGSPTFRRCVNGIVLVKFFASF